MLVGSLYYAFTISNYRRKKGSTKKELKLEEFIDVAMTIMSLGGDILALRTATLMIKAAQASKFIT